MPFFTPNVSNDGAVNVNEMFATVTPISANRTVSGSDVNTLIRVDASTGITVTLPANIPVGACVSFLQYGTGTITFAAGSGATFPQGSAVSPAQYQFVAAMVVANVGGNAAVWVFSNV